MQKGWVRAITLPAQMDAPLPFEFLTEPTVSNAQDAAVVHEEAGTVDPGASVPRRLKPCCSLIQFDDHIMWLSANSATSYLPLVVFGIDRPRGIGASQLQANKPFGHRQRRQVSCYSRGGNRPGRSAPFYRRMFTTSTTAATDLPEGTKGPSKPHKEGPTKKYPCRAQPQSIPGVPNSRVSIFLQRICSAARKTVHGGQGRLHFLCTNGFRVGMHFESLRASNNPTASNIPLLKRK